MINPMELVIGGFVVVLLFGTKRLPELGTGLGEAISNFRRSFRDAENSQNPQLGRPPENPQLTVVQQPSSVQATTAQPTSAPISETPPPFKDPRENPS